MPVGSLVRSCPAWCARHHAASPPISHYGLGNQLHLQMGSRGVAESVEVRTVQYLPEADGPAGWLPFVELAHHLGDRYRMMNLTGPEARELATHLLRCADDLESDDHSH